MLTHVMIQEFFNYRQLIVTLLVDLKFAIIDIGELCAHIIYFHNANRITADVACQQFGYKRGQLYYSCCRIHCACSKTESTSDLNVYMNVIQYIHNFILGLLYRLDQFDVTLPNLSILLSRVQCTGNETSLFQCSHIFSCCYCDHDKDIVLECVGKNSTHFM